MAMGDFNGTIWDSVKEGDECTCGFLQVDIVRSSHLEGSPQDIQKTKENFRNFVTSILENLYDALELRWAGDGGAFIFLIKDPNKDYDMVVKAAIQVLTNMPFFNGMRKLLNLLDQDIIIRISCHAGKIVYSKKVENIHGEELNFFLKHEKEIMKHEDAITLTEDIYNKLSYLRDYFEQSGPFEYNVGSGRCSKMLYKSKDWIKWYPRGDDFLDLAVTIRKIAANNTPFGKTLLAFAKDSLQTLKNNMDGLRSEKGALLTLPDLINLTNYCFKYATSKSNKYDGTDRCTPSKFFKTYPSYLESQADFIKRNEASGVPGTRRGTRILIVEDDTLRRDKNENNESYMEFLKWHEEHKVSLKKIDPVTANNLKEGLSIPTSEFGIWYKCYALIFKPEGDKTRLWLAYPEESMYRECEKYFELLDNYAREFTTELFDKKLAENWEEFIWPEKRWETEKDFLLNILEPYRDRNGVILDAAAGIGVDYVYLKKERFNCFANEIEPELRRVGEQFTSKRLNVIWTPYSILWEDFGEHFNSDWDVILVLGNSFCLILDERTREKCIENFMKALNPGGMLVIDQRNFEYMLKNKEEIQQDPMKNFRYKEEFIYCQRSIKGVPFDFGKNVKGAITFIYFPKYIKDIKEAYKARIGQLHMYPFRKGELRSLLEKKGFKEIKEYSDFKEGYDEGADFFTYTAIRPKET
jgi:glycine/sarcosine N-methyltransferase